MAEAPPRERPELLTLKQKAAWARRRCGVRAGAVRLARQHRSARHPATQALHEDLWDIVTRNQQDGDKAKGAVAVDALPGWARPPRS